MPIPTLKCVINFSTGASFGATLVLNSPTVGLLDTNVLGDAASVIVDVTNRIQAARTNRGRSPLTETFNTGTASIQIADQNGDFDPTNPTSPYAGLLQPLRKITLTAVHPTTLIEYPVFAGYITGYQYTQSRDTGTVSYTIINAVDGFMLMNLASLTTVAGTSAGELSGNRINDLLDAIAWPSGQRQIDAGQSTMQADPATARTALAALQTVASSEYGAMFMDALGNFNFKDRSFVTSFNTNCRFMSAGTYLYLPGIASNNATSQDSAALDITGDIDLRAFIALDNWSPSASQRVIVKGGNNQLSYELTVSHSPSGYLVLRWSAGGATQTSVASTVAVSFAAGIAGWIRATRVASTGLTKFYTSTNGTTWTQLGADVSAASGNIFSGTGNLFLGQNWDTGNPMSGKFFRAQVLNGINGTVVFDANFETSITSLNQTTFTESSSNAATVTINRSGSTWRSAGITTAGYLNSGNPNSFTLSSRDYKNMGLAGTVTSFNDTGTGISYANLQWILNDAQIFNQANITPNGLATQTASDATSIGTYFLHSYNASNLLMQSTTEALNYAQAFVASRKDTTIRADYITLDLTTANYATGQTAALALEYFAPVTISQTQPAGNVLTKTFQIFGVAHDIRPNQWKTTFTTLEPIMDGFILNDANFGVLGDDVLSY